MENFNPTTDVIITNEEFIKKIAVFFYKKRSLWGEKIPYPYDVKRPIEAIRANVERSKNKFFIVSCIAIVISTTMKIMPQNVMNYIILLLVSIFILALMELREFCSYPDLYDSYIPPPPPKYDCDYNWTYLTLIHKEFGCPIPTPIERHPHLNKHKDFNLE